MDMTDMINYLEGMDDILQGGRDNMSYGKRACFIRFCEDFQRQLLVCLVFFSGSCLVYLFLLTSG